MVNIMTIYDCVVDFINFLKPTLIDGYNCHPFSAITVFCFAGTWFLVGCKALTLTGEVVEWNWRLFSGWALSMAWYLSAHCLRLRRTHRYHPQRADAYIMWILVWTMVEVVLHAGALHIHKTTAQNPIPYSLGDTLLLTLPAVITGFALRCSMPNSPIRNMPPGVDVELQT